MILFLKKISASCGTSFSESEQRAALADVLDWAGYEHAESRDLPVVLIHGLFDSYEDGSENAGQFGVVAWSRDDAGEVSRRAKPAYSTVRCRFGGPC